MLIVNQVRDSSNLEAGVTNRNMLDTSLSKGLSFSAGLLTGAASLLGMNEKVVADDVKVRATIGGVEQLLSIDDPRIVREVVPAQSGSGYQTNIWVKTGEKSVRSAIEYAVPETGAVKNSATYAYDAVNKAAQGLEVSWSGKKFVIESFAVRAIPQYGSVSTFEGIDYPADTSRFFAYNLYEYKTAEDLASTHILPQGGGTVPQTVIGSRGVERYIKQTPTIAVSSEGNSLTITDEGDGKILLRAEHAGTMVMDGKGFIAFNAETPIFFNFAGFHLFTTSAPSMPGMRSVGLTSLGNLIYNDSKASWVNANNAQHLPMSTTLSEVVPAQIVSILEEVPIITNLARGEQAGTWNISINPGAEYSSGEIVSTTSQPLPNGYRVECTTGFGIWENAVLISGTVTNAVFKPPAQINTSRELFVRLAKP